MGSSLCSLTVLTKRVGNSDLIIVEVQGHGKRVGNGPPDFHLVAALSMGIIRWVPSKDLKEYDTVVVKSRKRFNRHLMMVLNGTAQGHNVRCRGLIKGTAYGQCAVDS